MTTIHNYNPEKKDASFLDIYIMAGFVAFVLVFILIATGYGLKFLAGFVIKYYLWVLGVIAFVLVARHYLTRDRRRPTICEYH